MTSSAMPMPQISLDRQSFWRNEISADSDPVAGLTKGTVIVGDYEICLPLQGECDNPELPLSQREKQVLFFSAVGLSGPEIADKIGVTANTVSTFKRRILQKLGCRSMSQAAVVATAYALGAKVRENARTPHRLLTH